MYQLKISIDKITPPIWRTIQVPESFTFNQLHHIIQIAFGWTNSHLYKFGVWEHKIGDPILWGDGEIIWDKKIKVKDVLSKVGEKFPYEYDMGDSWKHTIVLKKIAVGGSKTPRCLNGARSAPPEDCGGVPGYQELIHHLKHPEKDGYIELLEWLGDDYDPERFDLAVVNRELKGLAEYIREFDEENGLNT
ncbi:MAG: plasmid pRiA4b ORF-3 family protein [Bacteroidales bacterium]|jgi:hypothetical protein